MRVLFDAFWWAEGPIANQAVLKEFVYAWLDEFPEDHVTLAIRSRHLSQVANTLPSDVDYVVTSLSPHAVCNALELGRLAYKDRSDIVICHNYTPLFGRSIVFIHDLLFEDHPEWFSLKERVYFWPMARLARRAIGVATSTETEANRITRLHPNLEPVSATGLSVSSSMRTANSVAIPQMAEHERFFLSVGRLNIRKNLLHSINGYLQSSARDENVKLLIAGSATSNEPGIALSVEAESAVEAGDIVFLGHVSDAELKWLYERTLALLYMSFDEGFGLPPVEAQRYGAPVIVSDIPVFHETLGQSVTAHFADVLDVASVANAINRILSETETVNAIAHKPYTWKHAVQTLHRVADQSIGRA